jgi:transcriptional regulator with XRE-family HTH domain
LNVDDTERALAEGIRRRRADLGYSQRRLAAEMVAAGCGDWTGSTVANVERTDKRPRVLTIAELGALCAALHCSLDELLADEPDTVQRLRGQSPEAGSTGWNVDVIKAQRDAQLADLRVRLAESLGVTVDRVDEMARDLWPEHDDVLAVRDAALLDDPPGDSRDRAKRLGHATRAIREELLGFLRDQELPAPGVSDQL